MAFAGYTLGDLDNFIPEMWANESLKILEENMVMGNLVHRDFNSEIASFGETVHTRRPAEFSAVRKVPNEAVTDQDTTSVGVDVVLNQHIHVSFVIYDEDQTKAFKDLVNVYMEPAMMANARMLDQSLCGRAASFLSNQAGALGGASSSTISNYMLDCRKKMNDNKAYPTGRNLVMASASETAAQKADIFKLESQIGDGSMPIRRAYLGRLHGFETYLDINTPTAQGTTEDITSSVMAAAEPAGETSAMTNYCNVVLFLVLRQQ
jgi:hypothetical protein